MNIFIYLVITLNIYNKYFTSAEFISGAWFFVSDGASVSSFPA